MGKAFETFETLIVTALLVMCGGYSCYIWSTQEPVSGLGSLRNPAAIDRRHIFDFSDLSGSVLSDATHKQLLKGLRIEQNNGDFGVSLGHFFMKGSDGESHKVCELYDQVDISFEAEGMAVSGQRPQLTVTSDCTASEDWSHINPIWIPVQRLGSETPSDTEFTVNQDRPVTMTLKHIDMSWPHQWVLSQVRVYNKADPGKQILVQKQELHQTLANPAVMIWSFNR